LTTLQRYLFRQLTTSTLAVVAVLVLVSLGGVFADLVSEIARGKIPAPLLITQLGLRMLSFLPLVLPLALFVGLIMALSRMYRDSEMAVLAALGQGPRQLLKPMAWLVLPMVALLAVLSTVVGPWAERTARAAVDAANQSFLVAGLDAGRFVELPGGNGVVYVGEISPDGSRFERLFVQMQRRDRVDVITAVKGEIFIESGARFLRLRDGFRAEGIPGALDFRLQRFAVNEVRLPDVESRVTDPLAGRPFGQLAVAGATPRAWAEWHWRIGLPLIALLLAVLAIPLSRSPPRQARFGRLIIAVLAYIVGMNLLVIGKTLLGDGRIPLALGLWWLHLPLAAVALWQLSVDGRLPRRRRLAK
jgi:lipopolysaccharide export system permease protein